ncbi:two-component system sensor histidine kinase CreC [Ideonella sp. 4Y16]|uniref:histidine kinase n=1 Tax=Ideonella alba TaxID=2824118 RepID=A0A940Y399_9BURK|nr:two-component system sensor histidine kinase CreC [Ideonella alba]MBQ0928927.1 two-component system sensor histidine kinase CreC [Ideonella alba]MBQ0942862.1 two-component system sensor histidine kinase CreC [Ideonella alba]
MRLGLRLLFAFLLITGLASLLVMRVFLVEVKPSVREVMEDVLVDSANLLAEAAADDLAAMPPGGDLRDSAFARSVHDYARRPVQAQIWGLHKRSLDFRIYVTDAQGRVVFDSGTPSMVGADYSRWRDVARTLKGEYGARTTRDSPDDELSTVMHVAAPVQRDGRLLGVLTVAKPNATVQPFIDRAERKILQAGTLLIGVSALVGLAVTFWTVRSVRQLRDYARHVGDPADDAGARLRPPALPGELGELAGAMDAMRQRLAGRARLENDVRALTHELKAPMAAIRGAAELLRDDLPAADRQHFAGQIEDQVRRQQDLVDRLLMLSTLQGLEAPARTEPVDLTALSEQVTQRLAPALAQRRLHLVWQRREPLPLRGDAPALELALSNLLLNALQHAPEGSVLTLDAHRDGDTLAWSLRDEGPGVPDFALPQLGQRFFSTPNPVDGRKGSGLGLAIVAQVVALHGGQWQAEAASPGLRVRLRLPAASH